MDDDVREDVERRVRELRGLVQRGASPRRVLYLSTALYDIVSQHPESLFTDAWKSLNAILDTYAIEDTAKAIFAGREIEFDSDQYKRFDAPPGGWPRPDNNPVDGESGGSWGQAGFAGIPGPASKEAGPGKRGRKVREGASEYKRERRTDAAGIRQAGRRSLYDYREDRDGGPGDDG
jgi:hypothetical protein